MMHTDLETNLIERIHHLLEGPLTQCLLTSKPILEDQHLVEELCGI